MLLLIVRERGRSFKVNLLFESLYGSVLGSEGFVAESGGECGGALQYRSIHAISCLYTNVPLFLHGKNVRWKRWVARMLVTLMGFST